MNIFDLCLYVLGIVTVVIAGFMVACSFGQCTGCFNKKERCTCGKYKDKK